MPILDLTEGECQQILNILGDVPWRISNPLLMKIGQQMQAQQQGVDARKHSGPPNRADGKDSQEVHHG
jgi:hypothetical protein